jgi:tetratricopeptide (TPR) repeat protein
MADLDFSEIAKLNERYNKNPESKIFVQLADAYRKNDMIDEALDVLNKGLQHHPHYPLAYLIRGRCYFAKRIFAQAKESFEQVISLDPQNIIALRMLAQTCEALRDDAGQISAYKSIVAIDPLDTATKERLDRLERTQKKDTLYTITMAQEYEKQQNYSQALAIYGYLLSTDPTDLVLQQKVNELKGKVQNEEKKSEEEKIEGLRLESYFTAEDLKQKEEIITNEPSVPTMSQQSAPPETQIEQPAEKKDAASPPLFGQIEPASVTEDKKADSIEEEEVLSLEDFLTEETTVQSAKTPQEEITQHEKEIPRKQEREEFEQFFTEAEKAEIEGVVPNEQPQTGVKPPEETPTTEEIVEPETAEEPEMAQKPMKTEEFEKTEEPEKVEKLQEELKPDIQPQKSKPAEEKKSKEEDFQSFKDWLSGLLK